MMLYCNSWLMDICVRTVGKVQEDSSSPPIRFGRKQQDGRVDLDSCRMLIANPKTSGRREGNESRLSIRLSFSIYRVKSRHPIELARERVALSLVTVSTSGFSSQKLMHCCSCLFQLVYDVSGQYNNIRTEMKAEQIILMCLFIRS